MFCMGNNIFGGKTSGENIDLPRVFDSHRNSLLKENFFNCLQSNVLFVFSHHFVPYGGNGARRGPYHGHQLGDYGPRGRFHRPGL